MDQNKRKKRSSFTEITEFKVWIKKCLIEFWVCRPWLEKILFILRFKVNVTFLKNWRVSLCMEKLLSTEMDCVKLCVYLQMIYDLIHFSFWNAHFLCKILFCSHKIKHDRCFCHLHPEKSVKNKHILFLKESEIEGKRGKIY